MEPDYIDEGEDATLDKIIAALESLLPAEPPPRPVSVPNQDVRCLS